MARRLSVLILGIWTAVGLLIVFLLPHGLGGVELLCGSRAVTGGSGRWLSCSRKSGTDQLQAVVSDASAVSGLPDQIAPVQGDLALQQLPQVAASASPRRSSRAVRHGTTTGSGPRVDIQSAVRVRVLDSAQEGAASAGFLDTNQSSLPSPGNHSAAALTKAVITARTDPDRSQTDIVRAERKLRLHQEVLAKRQEYFQSIFKMIKDPKARHRAHTRLQYAVKSLRHPLPVYLLAGMEPSYGCETQERYGKMGDGGKVLCSPFRILSGPDCMVYSYGSRLDCSFELDLKQHYPSCQIHVFDPTPSVAARYNKSQCSSHTVFHPFGLGGYQPTKVIENRTVTLRTLSQARSTLGHSTVPLNVLKMDVEGDEFDAVQQMVDTLSLRSIALLLLEVHTHMLTGTRMEKAEQFLQLFSNIERAGYVLYHKELNWLYGRGNAEFSFVHKSFIWTQDAAHSSNAVHHQL